MTTQNPQNGTFASLEELTASVENGTALPQQPVAEKTIEQIRAEQEAADAQEGELAAQEAQALLGGISKGTAIDDSFLDADIKPIQPVQQTAVEPVVAFVSDLQSNAKNETADIARTVLKAQNPSLNFEDTNEQEKPVDTAPAVEQAEAVTEEPTKPTEKRYDDFDVQVKDDSERDKAEGNLIETVNVLRDAIVDNTEVNSKLSQKAEKVLDVLANLDNIDLNSIQIDTKSFSSDPLAVQGQISLLESTRPDPTFPVILLKSGYKAEMASLTNTDKIEMRNVNGSPYDKTHKVLTLLHRKIRSTSVGRLTFDKFLDITAEEDYDTLVYGIFHATFPNPTEYSVTCPHCQTANTLKLAPGNLIEVLDQEKAGTYVREVLDGYNRGEEFLAESMVAKVDRIILPKSRIVVDLCTPNLRRMINTISLGSKTRTYPNEIVTLLKFIKGFFMPNVQAIAQGKAAFFEVDDQQRILFYINTLEGEDLKKLREAISERIRKYRVTYAIPKFNCAASDCGKEVANTYVDMMNMIFLGISEENIA